MVRARTKNNAKTATIPSRGWSLRCMARNLVWAAVYLLRFGHALAGAWRSQSALQEKKRQTKSARRHKFLEKMCKDRRVGLRQRPFREWPLAQVPPPLAPALAGAPTCARIRLLAQAIAG